MSDYPASRLRGLKTVPKLAPGQTSQTMRISGPRDVLAWAAALTAKERGAIFAAAYATRPGAERLQGGPPVASPLLAPLPKLAAPQTGQKSLVAGATISHVNSHARVIFELSQGGVLAFLDGAWVMTESSGARRTIGANVVKDMLRLGVLQEDK
jgi:hypothetical protein